MQHGNVVATMNGRDVAALPGWKCRVVVSVLLWSFVLLVALVFMGGSLSREPLV